MKHPREFGFVEGVIADVSADGRPEVILVSDEAKVKSPVVYVGIIEDGPVLKVGVSGHGLAARWKGILGVMNQDIWHRLRPNEVADGKRLIEHAAGKRISVWLKRPIRVSIPYAHGLVQGDFCARHAEETFLDQYYSPLFGKRLEGRTS
jgi:hypothetical protein